MEERMQIGTIRWASLLLGLASITVVLILAWSAVCMAHTGEQSFAAHCVMAGLTALILLPLIVVALRRS